MAENPVFLFFCFFFSFSFVFFLLFFFRLFFLSFCIYNRKNTYKNRKKQKNSKDNRKHRKNRNLPARPLEIFIFRGGSWAGNPVFLFFLFSFGSVGCSVVRSSRGCSVTRRTSHGSSGSTSACLTTCANSYSRKNFCSSRLRACRNRSNNDVTFSKRK